MKNKSEILVNNIVVLRAENKWTQKYVAEQLGVTRQTVHSLEANKYNPSLILAFKISKLFGKEINEIFTYYE
ncbi:helix-turn-helix transcriptional regulator [Alkalibacillus almallahensis]|uniref:helix-turn-helix transcriptional regulator n=1 Tax=Alkalibacillus almallahensis TaxID=1379154 RepID=UPI001423809E|nr:helix-turn-helix transcriptional regulator [Alkalibacillus almallahensis]NIK13117.1 putative transcriptional regulator [Alkalibacillus almallahensis]